MALSLALTACGALTMFEDVAEDDCSLQPVENFPVQPEGMRVGPAVASALCAHVVEVGGRTYDVGVGQWLDEDALEPIEFGPITRANAGVVEPVAYALPGVDPTEFLITRGDGIDDVEHLGVFLVLWGSLPEFPDGLCRYADPEHRSSQRNAVRSARLLLGS